MVTGLVRLVVRPFGRHSFVMNAIKKLYFVRTSKANLFKTKKSSSVESQISSPRVANEISKHRQFRVDMVNYIKLMFSCKSQFRPVF